MNKATEQLNADTLFAFQMALKGHEQFEFLRSGIWTKCDAVSSIAPHRIYHDIPEGWTRHDGEDYLGNPDAVIEEVMFCDGNKSRHGYSIRHWRENKWNSFNCEEVSERIYAYKLAAKSPEIPDGFTPWNGGECPVARDANVEYFQRNRNTYSALSGRCNWGHYERANDIIAYRVLEKKVMPWKFADAPAFARVMRKETVVQYVVAFFPDGVRLSRSCQQGHRIESYETLAADYLQLDNSPCGKEVEQ